MQTSDSVFQKNADHNNAVIKNVKNLFVWKEPCIVYKKLSDNYVFTFHSIFKYFLFREKYLLKRAFFWFFSSSSSSSSSFSKVSLVLAIWWAFNTFGEFWHRSHMRRNMRMRIKYFHFHFLEIPYQIMLDLVH